MRVLQIIHFYSEKDLLHSNNIRLSAFRLDLNAYIEALRFPEYLFQVGDNRVPESEVNNIPLPLSFSKTSYFLPPCKKQILYERCVEIFIENCRSGTKTMSTFQFQHSLLQKLSTSN